MESVRVFTSDRMQAIEDNAITNGHVDGDDLILVTHAGDEVNAGSVRGPVGPIGSSPIIVTSTTHPTTGLYEGLIIYETDTNKTYIYDGSGWQSYEPTRICTSTTHPGSPFVGMEIYETDTHKKLVWNGFRFDKPWNDAWGLVAGGGVGGTWYTTETELIIAPYPVTFTALPNRRYKVTLNLGCYRGSVPGNHTFRIKRDVTTIRTINPSNVVGTVNDDRFCFSDVYYDSGPPAGVHNYHVTAIAQNPGPYAIDQAIQSSLLLVEDVGPWGPPA